MGRQWNEIIQSLGGLTGGTISINANLTDIDALLTTLQADIADGITVSSGTVNVGNLPTNSENGNLAVRVNGDGVDASLALTGRLPNGSQASISVEQTASLPVTISSYSTSTLFSKLQDGSGNAITSSSIGGKQRLDVNLSSAGTVGSSAPTTANLYAGTDGTNLRAVSVDTNGRVNINQVRGTTTIGTLTASTSNGTLFASNSTRNYLLVQCTSGTAYIDTNGTATTANGVLLTSGQGITFEGSFIPTGAIAAITSTGTAQLIGRQG